MELFQFLTSTTEGKMPLTMLVSMIPVIELRGGCPSEWPWDCPIILLSRRRWWAI